MLNCVVNSEKEYLQLIRDCIIVGVRVINPNAEGDSDDQSISDSFETLSPEVARDYLGYVIDFDDDSEEEYFMENEFDSAYIEEREDTPKSSDYPIFIHWYWLDDYDRTGSVKIRNFQFYSLKNMKNAFSGEQSILKTDRDLWESKYRKEVIRMQDLQREMNQRRWAELNAAEHVK